MRARLLLGLAALLLASGCLADPQQAQTRDLLDRLAEAQGQLKNQPSRADACTSVGDIETRLYGEPGLTDVQPAWSELASAAQALQAVCGQSTLLSQSRGGDSAALEAAHERWQQGIQRELGVACDHLRAAAAALQRSVVC